MSQAFPVADLTDELETHKFHQKKALVYGWSNVFYQQAKTQLLKGQDVDINQMQDLFRQSYKYVCLMEPCSIALEEGMKVLRLIPELQEELELMDCMPFAELLKLTIIQIITAYNDLKEYHDIVMTILDEEAITFQMAQSFADCSDALCDNSIEYNKLLGLNEDFLSSLDIDIFRPNPVDVKETKELVIAALVSKVEMGDSPATEKRDQIF